MYSLRKMSIRSKRIADTVEALIGVYLSAAGEQAAFLFLKSLGLDIGFHRKIQLERKITITYENFINVRSLEIILGYEFKDPSLLMEALTHGSYQIAGTTACYQVYLKASQPLNLIFSSSFFFFHRTSSPSAKV
jgi:endoribonuclease Dicer